jgi:hypothetical protein
MRLMGAIKHVLLVVARGIKKEQWGKKRIGRDASWGLAEIPLLGSEILRRVGVVCASSAGSELCPLLVVAGGWLSAPCASSAWSGTSEYRQQSYSILIQPA